MADCQVVFGKSSIYAAFFSDHGYVRPNKNPWDALPNNRSLWDAGLGFIWTLNPGFYFRCDYAWKIGSETAKSDTDQPGRFGFGRRSGFDSYQLSVISGQEAVFSIQYSVVSGQ